MKAEKEAKEKLRRDKKGIEEKGKNDSYRIFNYKSAGERTKGRPKRQLIIGGRIGGGSEHGRTESQWKDCRKILDYLG